MVAAEFQPTGFTIEQTFRQLQFHSRLLAAVRTGLTRVVRWHLMEMLAIALWRPSGTSQRTSPTTRQKWTSQEAYRFLTMLLGLSLSATTASKGFVVKKFVRSFREKVKALAGDTILLASPRRPSLCTTVRLRYVFARQDPAEVLRKFAFRLAIKARILFGFTLRRRQKSVRPNIYTTRRFWNTRDRIRHFANDKAIPAPRRLFQRDLFRVSDDSTMLADFDFTEFRDFQTVIPSACFTDRILTDTFTPS